MNYITTSEDPRSDCNRAGQYVGIYRTGAISLKYQDAISKKYNITEIPKYRNKLPNIAIFLVWNI